MAPEPLSDLLNAVSPGRRGFLKTVLTGTAFAAPLMASFPMDGLSVDAAVAACSNQAFAPNMSASVADFVTHPLTCLNTSNMTVQRAPMFKAKLKDSKNHQRGTVTFEVDVTRCVIEYRLNLTGKLATVNYHSVGVPAAVLVIADLSAEYVLSAGRGEIGTALPCLVNMSDLVSAFTSGGAEVFVRTDLYRAHGIVETALGIVPPA